MHQVLDDTKPRPMYLLKLLRAHRLSAGNTEAVMGERIMKYSIKYAGTIALLVSQFILACSAEPADIEDSSGDEATNDGLLLSQGVAETMDAPEESMARNCSVVSMNAPEESMGRNCSVVQYCTTPGTRDTITCIRQGRCSCAEARGECDWERLNVCGNVRGRPIRIPGC